MLLPQYRTGRRYLEITDAWVREAPPSSRVLAAYMSINNTTESAISITEISSPDFETAELHRTVIDDGVARMLRVEQLDVPAGENIRLEPGGLHLMLFTPQRMLSAGDEISLTIHLSSDTCLFISAPVVRKAGGDHSHHHH